jgi:hypothetical protein
VVARYERPYGDYGIYRKKYPYKFGGGKKFNKQQISIILIFNLKTAKK